jgi:dynein light intermediate chain, axonemal
MIPPLNSLVRYDNPVLVSTTKERKMREKEKTMKGKGGKALPPVEGKGVSQTEDILNSILPPRCVFFP